MLKSLTILLVALFTASVVAFSYHHHADLADHPSCIYCKLAKDISSTEHAVHALPDLPESMDAAFLQLPPEQVHSFSASLANPRAPPA